MLLGATREEILDWIYPHKTTGKHSAFREKRVPNSAFWFLNSQKFKSWVSGSSSNLLWCPGDSKYSISQFRHYGS